MGILGSILGRRGKEGGYRTIDGGHPAPYPDMTDEQLYNYEIAFNIPQRTFDRPPSGTARESYMEPYLDHEPILDDERHQPAIGGTSEMEESADVAALDSTSEADTIEENDAERPADATGADPANPDLQGQVAPPIDHGPALDFTRPIRTITTRQTVDVLTTRARHPIYKVHAYIGDDAILRVFTLDGRLSESGPRFLENIPEVNEVYLNIYRGRGSEEEPYRITQHPSRAHADGSADVDRLACVRVELGNGSADVSNSGVN